MDVFASLTDRNWCFPLCFVWRNYPAQLHKPFAVGHLRFLHQVVQRLVHQLLCVQSHLAAARQQRSLQHHLVAQVRLVLLQVVQPHSAVPVQVGFLSSV